MAEEKELETKVQAEEAVDDATAKAGATELSDEELDSISGAGDSKSKRASSYVGYKKQRLG